MDGEGPVRGARSPSRSGAAGMRGSGRGIDARTSRCRPPSPDRLLGPPSREAIRGAPYKAKEYGGRRPRQSNSFQTRPVRVYSSIQVPESVGAGLGGSHGRLRFVRPTAARDPRNGGHGFIPSRTRRGPTAAPGCPRFLKGADLTPMWDQSEATPRRSLLGSKAFGHARLVSAWQFLRIPFVSRDRSIPSLDE